METVVKILKECGYGEREQDCFKSCYWDSYDVEREHVRKVFWEMNLRDDLKHFSKSFYEWYDTKVLGKGGFMGTSYRYLILLIILTRIHEDIRTFSHFEEIVKEIVCNKIVKETACNKISTGFGFGGLSRRYITIVCNSIYPPPPPPSMLESMLTNEYLPNPIVIVVGALMGVGLGHTIHYMKDTFFKGEEED